MGDNDAAIGELKGLYRGLEKTVDKLEGDVNAIYELLRKGFANSQSDREALGTTLGAKMDAMAKTVNRAQGSVSAYAWLINFLGMLCGGCLAGLAVHLLH